MAPLQQEPTFQAIARVSLRLSFGKMLHGQPDSLAEALQIPGGNGSLLHQFDQVPDQPRPPQFHADARLHSVFAKPFAIVLCASPAFLIAITIASMSLLYTSSKGFSASNLM